jgi:hypothetical protein
LTNSLAPLSQHPLPAEGPLKLLGACLFHH